MIKDANIPLLSIVITRGGRLLNVFDDVLMDGKLQSFKVMDDAHDAGQGPLRIRTRDMPLEMIEEIEHILFSTERPVQERFSRGGESISASRTSSCGPPSIKSAGARHVRHHDQ